MVNKCSAYGCKSGYSGNNNANISFHSYPLKSDNILKQWIKNNPREGFIPSKHSKICSLHFKESDFIKERSDSNPRRRKNLDKLAKLRLREDAVPTIFKNAPSYLSVQTPKRRKTSALSSNRLGTEICRMQDLEELMKNEDDISELSTEELLQRLKSSPHPSNYDFCIKEDCLLIYIIDIKNNIPTFGASITVNTSKNVFISVHNKSVKKGLFSDIIKEKLTLFSQLLNLMARLKHWYETKEFITPYIDNAINELKSFLTSIDPDSDQYRQIYFILEQLELQQKSKFSRHYSPELLIMCFMLYSTSSSAYYTLVDQNILCIPSISTLKKISRRVGDEHCLNNESYLKLRYSKLENIQTHVLLMIDEIYIAKRVEYSGGKIMGITSSGDVASTILCFMIRSIAGGYKDVIALYPITSLTAENQFKCYKEVMTILRQIPFNVVAISVDNATVNRKFFTQFLCKGKLSSHIIDEETQQPIYLIFDPVHGLKNLYNNFQTRKIFKCPPHEMFPKGLAANFHHIRELYEKEFGCLLKKAHKLSSSTINPKSIEKTSVKLAVSVFTESTRDALNYYSVQENLPTWSQTAEFISFVLKMWHIMNVKTCSKGKRKRDYSQDPVLSSMDWKLSFLRETASFLEFWEAKSDYGLSRETFLAVRHTCIALADCASYLLDRLSFSFVLLGKLQSDGIESRFGWLRQLSGANYYISMRQVLESDKKIRAISVLKYSDLSLSSIDNILSNSSTTIENFFEHSLTLIMPHISLAYDLNSSDSNIVYYVSGAVARSCLKLFKCSPCEEILICNEPFDHYDLDDSEFKTYFDDINRGGLVKPTNMLFLLGIHCYKLFYDLKHNTLAKQHFLESSCQKILFVNLVDRTTCDEILCIHNHNIKKTFVMKFFNCIAKNFVKDMSAGTTSISKTRKLSKLQSKY